MQNNPELRMAWQFIEKTGTSLFLTGKAGTGKTTFLRTLKERSPKRMVVLAPTGIAAINAGGVTIHSFFQLPFSPFVPDMTFRSDANHFRFSKEKVKIIRSMDLLVIDEISMVRADLLDAVDSVLRRYRNREKPFGGVQLLMIGDVQQLAPVVKDDEWAMLKDFYDSPYFFSSNALMHIDYMTIELKTVYRQQDGGFLALLNRVRENTADETVLAALNRRYIPDFVPPADADYIRLTTHNWQAQTVNERELGKLDTPPFSFKAEVKDNFPEYSYPTEETLTLKEGAQVMFVKNDSSPEKRYYNGMIGEVAKLSQNCIFVRRKGERNAFQLEPEEWTNAKYVLNEETHEITEQVEGIFRQYPLRLAWAITIHKSQGLTFEHAIIDAQNSFAHGQTYVALSRCKTLEGMVLGSPLRREAIISDAKVDQFNRDCEQNKPDVPMLHQLEKAYARRLVGELFDFVGIDNALSRVIRLIDEHYYKKYPELPDEYKAMAATLSDLHLFSKRFEPQYTALINGTDGDADNTALQQRIHSAATYFAAQLVPLDALIGRTTLLSDNKLVKKQTADRMETLSDAVKIKLRMLDYESREDVLFSVSDYLKKKASATLDVIEDDEGSSNGRKKREKKPKKEKKPKVDTKKVSYDMYCQGMTIDQIAKERGLVTSTIAGHLTPYIEDGSIDGAALISPKALDEVISFVQAYPEKGASLLAIKDNVSAECSYTDIRIALAVMKRR
jgi:hypothetical protein